MIGIIGVHHKDTKSQKSVGQFFSLCLRDFVVDVKRSGRLLDLRIARRPDAQVLSLRQANVPAPLAEHAGRADARADRRAHRGADSATGDGSDHRANARRDSDLLDIVFG